MNDILSKFQSLTKVRSLLIYVESFRINYSPPPIVRNAKIWIIILLLSFFQK